MENKLLNIYFPPTVWNDIIFIEYGGRFAVIDTGGVWQEDLVRRCFEKLGVGKPEFILLTHFHPDHYGCLEMIFREYGADTVYFKEYSGVTRTDGTGKVCSDDERKAELCNCLSLLGNCRKYARTVPAEGLSHVMLGDLKIELFNTENTVKKVFCDPSGELYGRYFCNENQNSIAAFFEIYGKTVFLGGDITDFDFPHPLINRMNTRISKEIGKHIDIYKAPHHGYGVGSQEALSVYTPSYVYITNSRETVTENTDTVERILASSPSSDISFASEGGVAFTITPDGEITKRDFFDVVLQI